jgi:hypothetical protein
LDGHLALPGQRRPLQLVKREGPRVHGNLLEHRPRTIELPMVARLVRHLERRPQGVA